MGYHFAGELSLDFQFSLVNCPWVIVFSLVNCLRPCFTMEFPGQVVSRQDGVDPPRFSRKDQCSV